MWTTRGAFHATCGDSWHTQARYPSSSFFHLAAILILALCGGTRYSLPHSPIAIEEIKTANITPQVTSFLQSFLLGSLNQLPIALPSSMLPVHLSLQEIPRLQAQVTTESLPVKIDRLVPALFFHPKTAAEATKFLA